MGVMEGHLSILPTTEENGSFRDKIKNKLSGRCSALHLGGILYLTWTVYGKLASNSKGSPSRQKGLPLEA